MFKLAILALVCLGASTDDRSADPKTSPSPSHLFKGFVFDNEGAPGAGAVVVSSAGGQAIVNHRGSYRLEVTAPPEATRIQISVIGKRGASATTEVELGTSSRLVEPLTLMPGATCAAKWLPTFGAANGVEPGQVRALAVFDDGTGSALYVGGYIQEAGAISAPHIAKWDGSRWSSLELGLDGPVFALTTYDDGNGPALYVGGDFNGTNTGITDANNVAKWDGRTWSALDIGVSGRVFAMTVFDDGGGDDLYVGGQISAAGGSGLNNIARWDGSSWSGLGSGALNDTVNDLLVHDDGSGEALYIGGEFSMAGGVLANHIAKWDGSTWSPVGAGTNSFVSALVSFDDGGGDALYAGGIFSMAGGSPANRIAKWDGATWSPLGAGTDSSVLTMASFDDGSGDVLYVGGVANGTLDETLAKWDGATWTAIGDGIGSVVGNDVAALEVFDDGSEARLIVGGGSSPFFSGFLRSFDGTDWLPVGLGPDGNVLAAVMYDDGTGPALYAGGAFETAAGETINHIAKWNGVTWSPLGSGVDDAVDGLLVHDDGSGPALFASGRFSNAGGLPAAGIAKWDGVAWSPVGTGLVGGGFNSDMAIYDDGLGPRLYTCGLVTDLEDPVYGVSCWDGATWTTVATTDGITAGLAVHDDGTGATLYLCGLFDEVDGVAVNSIAKWDGTTWSSAGFPEGTAFVWTLMTYDDGNGEALYAGGGFSPVTGIDAWNIMKWDGTSWSALAGGLNNQVNDLAVHDDGSGAALYAVGNFTTADGLAAGYIARWDGTSWSTLGPGLDDIGFSVASFEAAGGTFLCAGGSSPVSGDGQLSLWGCRQPQIQEVSGRQPRER